VTQKEVAALIIWWCEGTKLRKDKRWKNASIYSIEVINSDPRIIKIFADFLVKSLLIPISRFKGQIQIHEGDDQEATEDFWLNYLSLSRNQLNKTIIRKRGTRKRNNHGTFKLRLYDKSLYESLQKRLDSLIEGTKIT
jgi:hypothetical protein